MTYRPTLLILRRAPRIIAGSLLDQCWASVVDDGPTLIQHCVSVSCSLVLSESASINGKYTRSSVRRICSQIWCYDTNVCSPYDSVSESPILVQWLKLPASKVGDREFEPLSGI